MLVDLPAGLPSQSSRYFAAEKSKRTHPPEDIQYLQVKGCFTVPEQHICDELIYRYFQLVHPLVPVVNAARFLQDFHDGTCVEMNLLLVWSIFCAASSVGTHISRSHGIF